MKFKKLNEMQKLICVSLLFTLALLAVRVAYTGTVAYLFYPWNLLLALVPFYFSGLLLKQKKFGWKTILVFASWFLFLPNAPYLVTDIFHFEERPPVPAWFDLLLVVSGAWNGVLICMISLFRIEKFLLNRCQIKSPGIIMFLLPIDQTDTVLWLTRNVVMGIAVALTVLTGADYVNKAYRTRDDSKAAKKAAAEGGA